MNSYKRGRDKRVLFTPKTMWLEREKERRRRNTTNRGRRKITEGGISTEDKKTVIKFPHAKEDVIGERRTCGGLTEEEELRGNCWWTLRFWRFSEMNSYKDEEDEEWNVKKKKKKEKTIVQINFLIFFLVLG